MNTRRLLMWVLVLAIWLVLWPAPGLCTADELCPDDPNCTALIRMEAEYIKACQYTIDTHSPAYGAINDINGLPTWVVPSENAMAILGLVMASEILQDPNYLACAQRAADYLVSVQDPNDGAWYNQYRYAEPDINDLGKSPRHTAEVMIALNKLGYDPNRYDVMKKGAEYLMSCQYPGNKGGQDDGLLGGGKDPNGDHQGWRWTHDNAYAYWALKAVEVWATKKGEAKLASEYASSAQRILNGINIYLYNRDRRTTYYGLWHVAIDGRESKPQWDPSDCKNRPSWIQYSPQMLDLPVDVNLPIVGEWIHNSFQKDDHSCIDFEWEDRQCKTRKSPGYSFQAALCWFDTGHRNYAVNAILWCRQSGLWQDQPDGNNQTGGWIDWEEVEPTSGRQPDWWIRFIDTSFYAIAAFYGGYDFRVR